MMLSTKVYLFCKGNVSQIPPVYNYTLSLANLGYKVVLVCGEIDFETEKYLTAYSKNIRVDKCALKGHSRLQKILMYRRYVNKRYNYVDGEIWFATFDTAICLYKSNVYKKDMFYLSVLELYDSAPRYIRVFLKILIRDAKKIIVPEYNRAAILKVWYRLDHLPVVIPNKPYLIKLGLIDSTIQSKLSELQRYARGRKIILYQGLITRHRDLDIFAHVIREFADTCVFVLIGPVFENYYKHLETINEGKNILYLDNLIAPYHLHITKMADVGILKYDFHDLNNIYCAPNKIWEYTAFDLVLLGNDVPGLRFYIDKYNAGEVIDFDSENDIRKGLKHLLVKFDLYKEGSKQLYNSVDYDKILNNMLNSKNQ